MTLPILSSPFLQNVPNLVHGFTTRQEGVSAKAFSSLNLGLNTGDDKDRVEENYLRVAQAFQTERNRWVGIEQEHGKEVVVFQKEMDLHLTSKMAGDALITNQSQIFLTVRVADCLPILLFDPETKAIGAVHAGWRGTLERVLTEAIAAMVANFKTSPHSLTVSFGPSIGKCCFEVSEGIVSLFEQQIGLKDNDVDRTQAKPHLDLVAINRRLALDIGIQKENIWTSNVCTFCNSEKYFSYRKHGKISGRFIGFIGWKI